MQQPIKCLVPLFDSSISTIVNGITFGSHSFPYQTLQSIYHLGEGFISKTSKCFIDYTYKCFNSIPGTSCNTSHAIQQVIYDENHDQVYILAPVDVHNNTTHLLEQTFNVDNSYAEYSILSHKSIVSFLGLHDCSPQNVLSSIREYLESLSITTTSSSNILDFNYTEYKGLSTNITENLTLDDMHTQSVWQQKINIFGNDITVQSLVISVAGAALLTGGVIGYVICKMIKPKPNALDAAQYFADNLKDSHQFLTEYHKLLDVAQSTSHNHVVPYAITPFPSNIGDVQPYSVNTIRSDSTYCEPNQNVCEEVQCTGDTSQYCNTGNYTDI